MRGTSAALTPVVTADGISPDVVAPVIAGGEAVARALEFRVGRVHLVMRLDLVARLIEVPYAPLPLTRSLVLGLGFDDSRPVVCVSLTRHGVVEAGAVIRAVLIRSPGRLGWALCADEVYQLTSIAHFDHVDTPEKLPRWVGRARTLDGRTLGWIDAEVMMHDLASGAEVAP